MKKQEEALEKALDELKKQYKVNLNESYFEQKAPAAVEQAKDMTDQEQLEMVMPEAPAQETSQAKRPAPTKAV